MEPAATEHTVENGPAVPDPLTAAVLLAAVAAAATMAAAGNSIAESADRESVKTNSTVITWLDSLNKLLV